MSRLVTSIRWVVKSANGRLKRWKYFEHKIPNRDFQTVEADFKFVCALMNTFRPQISATNGEDVEMFERMLELSEKETSLKNMS